MNNVFIKKIIDQTPKFIKEFLKKDDRISSKIADTVKQVNEKDKQFMAKKNEIEKNENILINHFCWPFKEDK